MSAYILRRVLQSIPILLGVTMLTFVIVNATGSPFRSLRFDPRIKPEDIARIERNLGLDRPWYERYFTWLGNLATGDLGYSMVNGVPVKDRILSVIPNTLLLSGLSLLLSFSIALPIGIYAALRQNSIFDRVSTTVAIAGYAIPTFWLGMLLIILFSVKFREWGLPYLPVSGVRDMRGAGGFTDRVEHLILPVVALTIPQLAGWVVYVRSTMLEVIRQDYMRTASAKGLTKLQVVLRHGFRNAILPLITLVGLNIPDIFGGALLIENTFAYPGMGRLAITSVESNDYTMVMAITLFFAILVVLGNLIADLLYVKLDPRVRLD